MATGIPIRVKPHAFEVPVFDADSLPQRPGCLPAGYTLDSMLTPDQFCVWQQIERPWFAARITTLPGVIAHTRQMVRIHPRAYLEGSK